MSRNSSPKIDTDLTEFLFWVAVGVFVIIVIAIYIS